MADAFDSHQESAILTVMFKIPEQPKNSFRVVLTLTSKGRIDAILLDELKKQNRNLPLKNISRRAYKGLFKAKRITLKGQPAVPSSLLAVGVSYVDILGFVEKSLIPAEDTAAETVIP